MKIIKVYVGCALTYAGEDFKRDIEFLKIFLRSIKGVEVLEFIGLVNGTPVDVYEHDIHNCVGGGDLIIAECSFPSTGLGWEIGTAVEKHKKHVLAVAKADAKVTRLVIGAQCERNPNYSFQTYDSLEKLFDICTKKIKQIQGLQQ
ncbi:hypothetical protein KKA39_02325 [Patescibacteria group bacterium]|nr:hypothetical protein [Patescibacteria group bacterium]MBU1728117.1 hypothetical protein [Patescibacteria group bacterium]